MARTDSERLTFWRTLRDSIEDAIAEGVPVLRYKVGGREVEREPTGKWLNEVDSLIARLESRTSAASGTNRNRARLKRRP